MYLQICLIVCLLSIFQYRSKYDSGTETIGPGQHWQSRGNSTHRTHKVTRCTLPPQPALIVVHLVFYRSSHREPTGQCGPIGKRTTAGVSGRNNLQNFHGTIPLSKLSFLPTWPSVSWACGHGQPHVKHFGVRGSHYPFLSLF